MSQCRVYLILLLKVRRDKLFPKALKFLEKLNTKIEYINEEQRRIIVNVPENSLPNIVEIINEFAEYASYEVKASCSLRDINLVKDRIKNELRFKLITRGSSSSFVGTYNDRLFNLEIKGKRLYIKIGNRYIGKHPSLPLPTTLFVFEYKKIDEIRVLINELKEFIKAIVKEV